MSEEIQVRVPYDAGALAALQVEAEADAIALVDFTVPDDETYQVADQLLTGILQRLDAVEKTEAGITGPIKEGLKNARALFAPLRSSLDACVVMVKRAMAAHVTEKARLESEARKLALAAAKAGDDTTMAEALTVAADAAEKPATGAQARPRWIVERTIPGMIPDEYWCVDEAKIGAIAKAWPGQSEDPPIIPGVIFKRVFGIAGKH